MLSPTTSFPTTFSPTTFSPTPGTIPPTLVPTTFLPTTFVPTFSEPTFISIDAGDVAVASSTPTLVSSTSPSSALMVSNQPSTSPTLRDCLITPEERIAQIYELLDAVGNQTSNRDLDTPQGLAANWLINQDFLDVCPDEKIVQRWALAVFYFATRGETWTKCSAAKSDPCGEESPFNKKQRFLSDFSECEWAGITCNNDDCVTEVEFEENELAGTM